MRAEEILETLTDDELREKADACFIQAENTPSYQHADVGEVYLPINAAERQRLLAEADFYLKALAWRSDARTARRDFWMEVAVIVLIGVEIILSLIFGFVAISEGRQQAAILQQMNKSTADTDAQIQRAADATTSSLEILRQERAEQATKPRLALYLGNTPVDGASVHLKLTGSSHDIASLDLLLKNSGDAPVSPFRLHALTPEGVWLQNPTNTQAVRQFEPEANGFTVQLPLLPAGQSARVLMQLLVPAATPPSKSPSRSTPWNCNP